MLEKKTIEVVICDVCGVDDNTAQIRNISLLVGLGYQPSNDDPLAQKFKKLYKLYDVCDRCYARMDHNFLGLSTEEKEQIVYSCLMEYDNRKDLRDDPQEKDDPTIKKWPVFAGCMDTIQDKPVDCIAEDHIW